MAANEVWFSLLYSYPTWDRNYRGQRGIRVKATSEQAALRKVQKGYGGYPACPGATIVRCQISSRQEG